MSNNSKKRTLDAFFAPSPSAKKAKSSEPATTNASNDAEDTPCFSSHTAYPHAIRDLPPSLAEEIKISGSKPGKVINDQPHLDLLYFQPYMPRNVARELFEFLRRELPFYRVEYNIRRGNVDTRVKTPRYTTVFGIDSTSCFTSSGQILTTSTQTPVVNDKNYSPIPPRPIPACLDTLRQSTETATSQQYNFCLVNYYFSGSDSISYHSDDEHFLGKDPAIASFSLGERRDFLMKRKPIGNAGSSSGLKLGESRDGGSEVSLGEKKPLKLQLGSGDMVLMKGATQKNWLHSIPKRSGKGEGGGRINITFRKAIIRAGTENYYKYNVGTGPVYRWDDKVREMKLWKEKEKGEC